MDENIKQLIVPISKGVPLPSVEFTLLVTTPYLKKVIKEIKPGQSFIASATSKSLEGLDDLDPKNLYLDSIGVRCLVKSIKDEEVIKGSKTTVMHIYGCNPVRLANTSKSEEGLLFAEAYPYLDMVSQPDQLKSMENIFLKDFNDYKNQYPLVKDIEIPEDLDLTQRPYHYAAALCMRDGTKLSLLHENNPNYRYTILINGINEINQAPKVDNEIETATDQAIQRGQREYVLRERAKAIKKMLSEYDGDDTNEKYDKLLEKNIQNYPPAVANRLKSEISRLKLLGSGNQETAIVRNYVDLLMKLPWNTSTEDNDDLGEVKKILDEDHYGLVKQKERILEYLAVKTMTKSLKAPILCLYGPPGVGKTSLAISIARALNRKFVKFALGGVYDESEIRGHRRTYIAAMPGRIISGIANTGTNNPVFLLDEIDKMEGGGYHGDPAAALLEILDPEQNINFQDNYLDLPFDLSNVLFICTANDISEVPAPLRDRLELIELNTYTLYEKLHIAKQHLIKQELKANGLTEDQISFTDEALTYIIDSYTREAGVRELRRKIGTCMRKFEVDLLSGKKSAPFVVTNEVVEQYLKMPIYFHTRPLEGQVGIVNGLAFTSYGGEILPIECNILKGKGNFTLTGNLGNVMKESMNIAFSYVKALAQKFGYGPKYFNSHDFHIHAPEGAVPKDGPSAGCAIALVILSAITEIPLNSNVALTGEVDLRGRSMQIGGLREKTLAAVREHMKKVMIPKDNHNDYLELPAEVKDNLEVVEVENVEQMIPHIFMRMPEERPIEEEEEDTKEEK